MWRGMMCEGWCVDGCVVGGYCYGRPYGNRFCMMKFVKIIGGYVKMMRLCSSRTRYVGTMGYITVIHLGCVGDCVSVGL